MTDLSPTPAALSEAMSAPYRYQTAWQFGENGTAVLLTAEEWLEEEATVYASTGDLDDGDDGPSREGIMRAIAKEIATLRQERTQWAEAATAKVKENQLLTAEVTRLRAAAEAETAIGYVLWSVEENRVVNREVFHTKKGAHEYRDLYCPPRKQYEIRAAFCAARPSAEGERTAAQQHQG